jgi:hypothetical protein
MTCAGGSCHIEIAETASADVVCLGGCTGDVEGFGADDGDVGTDDIDDSIVGDLDDWI